MKQYIYTCKIFLISLILLCSSKVISQESETTLKVMTYNIWNGFDWGKDTERRENLVNWVKSQKSRYCCASRTLWLRQRKT